MTAACRLLVVMALVLAAGCAAVGRGAPAAISLAPVAEDPSRQVLVTFVDRALRRPPFGSPGGYLRRGADYGTTAWSHALGATIAARHNLRTVTEWPIMTLGVHCVVYAVDDARQLAAVLAELRADENVDSAQAMGTFHVLGADPYAPLQRSVQGMNLERAHRRVTGRGVSVAIVDTGVDLHHPDLAGQIAEHTDLAGPPEGSAFDNDIHGTAVAGVIAALAGNGEGIVGIAPDARLLVFRACWPTREGQAGAVCNSLSLATALDAAIRARPQIINLSLTGPEDPLLQALLSAAVAKRILVVVAEPPRSGATTSFVDGLEQAIRVRAAGGPVTGGDSAGATVIAAPGTDILTTFPHGTYNFISGSSFAAANVTGLIALLLQADPGLGIADVRYALNSGAVRDVGSAEAGGIDACAALQQVGAGMQCPR